MTTIVSKSGPSKDVRRIYHGDTKGDRKHASDRDEKKPREPMRQWARRYVTIARIGTAGDGVLGRVATVAGWLNGKGVR